MKFRDIHIYETFNLMIVSRVIFQFLVVKKTWTCSPLDTKSLRKDVVTILTQDEKSRQIPFAGKNNVLP